jgi:hypothetical protein
MGVWTGWHIVRTADRELEFSSNLDITLKVESLFTASLHISNFVQTQNKAKILTEIIENQSPAERVCSQGLVYWSHNDACAQVLGQEHSGRVRGVGLGPTPSKSTFYTSGEGSISNAPTPKELEMAAEMERLKTLYETQQEELAAVKRMVDLIMAEKQSSMGNNEEGDVLIYT